MERLFLAVPLTEAARVEIATRLERVLPTGLPGRRVPPANWHFTLRFLGETPPELAARLVSELRDTPLPPAFTFELGDFGAFPNPARASVLWLGVGGGAARLVALAGEIETAVRRAGFPAETRPFAAHLTLSRLRPALDVRPFLESLPPQPMRLPATEVVLYRSDTGAGPVRYEPLERFTLR